MPNNAAAIALPPVVVEPPTPKIEDLVEDAAVAAIGAIAKSVLEYQDGGLSADTKMFAGGLLGRLAELWLTYPEVEVDVLVRERLGRRGAPDFLVDALVEIVTMVRTDELAFQRAQAH